YSRDSPRAMEFCMSVNPTTKGAVNEHGGQSIAPLPISQALYNEAFGGNPRIFRVDDHPQPVEKSHHRALFGVKELVELARSSPESRLMSEQIRERRGMYVPGCVVELWRKDVKERVQKWLDYKPKRGRGRIPSAPREVLLWADK